MIEDLDRSAEEQSEEVLVVKPPSDFSPSSDVSFAFREERMLEEEIEEDLEAASSPDPE